MNRWLPYPAISVFILAAWLLLNQSIAAGHLLLGAVLGVSLPALLRRLDLPSPRLRNHHLILVLAWRVGWDIVRSNFEVMGMVLSGRRATPGFVSIPLTLTDGYGLAALACIITSTPGTLWISYESRERVLIIHVFNLTDEAASIRTIIEQYERPLREIFE